MLFQLTLMAIVELIVAETPDGAEIAVVSLAVLDQSPNVLLTTALTLK
jgi:hypothetical protein